MKIKSAKFVISVADKSKLLNNFPEFAFVGRSNVGKSSLINYITCQKNLAKTSSTPGLTKLINYFEINEKIYLVDLPGYGYHKAGKGESQKWSDLIENYFKLSTKLKCVLLLVDIRHDLSLLDAQMLNYLNFNRIPYMVILTKADKLSKSEQNNAKVKFAVQMKIGTDNIIVTSVNNRIGSEEICKLFDN